MGELIDLYLDSDYVGMATPVYGLFMTALLKNFTDRLLPLATPHILEDEKGDFYHDARVNSFPGQFFIANSGFPGQYNFELLKNYFELVRESGQEIILEIYRNCGEVLQNQAANPRLSAKVAEFSAGLQKAGREMVTNGEITEETRAQIQTELISDQEYLERANQFWDEEIRGVEVCERLTRKIIIKTASKI